MNREGKRKRVGTVHGQRMDWKKAVVTLPAGASIALPGTAE